VAVASIERVDVIRAAARSGDEQAFEQLVAGHRRELQAHCYRMLGSLQDAEDALQETLLAAWRGLGGEPVLEPIWLDPWPSDPAEDLVRRESIGLAYVAALQHLPPNQRAVLILRDVLAFTAEETAVMLATSTASVNSALQRARRSMTTRTDGEPTVAEQHRGLLDAFVKAWESADVDALVGLLSHDVVFTMPPLPAWFEGRADVVAFIRHRALAAPWRLLPVVANAQPAFGCYQLNGSAYLLGAVNVLSVSGDRISWIAGFVDPAVTARFGLPHELLTDR
jgi:RNA polymerase sigma-70 factor (TIGR02960 family)